MIKKEDFKVTLINKDEVKNFVKQHGQASCICYNTDEKYAESVGKSVLKTGHLSGSRGDYFKFKIENIPRDCIDQMTRHDVGTFKNVQSFRYVNKNGSNIYYPPEVLKNESLKVIFDNCEFETNRFYRQAMERLNELGYTGEKANEIARHMKPIGTESSVVIGFTLEAIINFMNKRLCSCSELPIRHIAKLMRDEILSVAPIYEEYLVPICERQLWCPESKERNCGRKPTKDELIEIIKENSTLI